MSACWELLLPDYWMTLFLLGALIGWMVFMSAGQNLLLPNHWTALIPARALIGWVVLVPK